MIPAFVDKSYYFYNVIKMINSSAGEIEEDYNWVLSQRGPGAADDASNGVSPSNGGVFLPQRERCIAFVRRSVDKGGRISAQMPLIQEIPAKEPNYHAQPDRPALRKAGQPSRFKAHKRPSNRAKSKPTSFMTTVNEDGGRTER